LNSRIELPLPQREQTQVGPRCGLTGCKLGHPHEFTFRSSVRPSLQRGQADIKSADAIPILSGRRVRQLLAFATGAGGYKDKDKEDVD
jgi:hypothetical protein